MHVTGTFTVEPSYPPSLAPLATLAQNLRWVWDGPTQDLFATLAPQQWAATLDPLETLRTAPQDRIDALGVDEGYLARVDAAAEDLRRYLDEPRWAAGIPGGARAVAYFSMEFGVSQTLPNYSGGLGILAGDHLKAASDLGVPLVALGLMYRSGYFKQTLSADGWQQEQYPQLDPSRLPLTPVLLSDGQQLTVSVTLDRGRVLHAIVWRADVGRVPLLLLDADVDANEPDLRSVTDRLYGGDAEHRLRQEILLGIGGVRAARAYCDLTGHPGIEVFHANEGHAGFLGLERTRELMAEQDLTFDEALALARCSTVFTTHTPVPAGIDRFPADLVRRYFGDGETCVLLPTVGLERMIALGAEADPGVFNMAHMGFRLAQRANGVSRLHGEVSREMFAGLWPDLVPSEVPIGSVTNGVHRGTWAARAVRESLSDPLTVPSDVLWGVRNTQRANLVDEVRTRTRAAWRDRGAVDAELGWTERMFDPDVLTIGFARRVSTYKRLTLMLREPDRLRRLLLDPERPIQVVIAGKSHPADDGGKHLLQQLIGFIDDPAIRHRIAFLPNYSIGMAGYLYHGCDVWLNNPLRPLEACGTSGMKSALNGGLNLSVLDGWWDELYDGENGWAIPSAVGLDPSRRDDIEAAALYDLLENDVVPAFYGQRDEQGVPKQWLAKVRHTLAVTGPEVTADRMVREYTMDYYRPAAQSYRATAPHIRELAAFADRIHAAWDDVAVQDSAATVGPAGVTLTADVALGGLAVGEVRVEAVLGPLDEAGALEGTSTVQLAPARAGADGTVRYQATVSSPVGHFGFTARVLPRHELLSGPAELGLVRYAK
ncbi:alpha-glucan family phosphorylase [Tsukamurella soli]|uniref:glycogen phosphorylase n=1 Tax=Tsukamurella soli TaxID=644556 RepID=A0ABP8KIQ7_9ACTN